MTSRSPSRSWRPVVVLFVSNRVPVGIVAIGAALSLWATGVLTLEQALAGFGDPTVLFIASLFVVSEGLDATGVTAWAGQQLVDRAGTGRTRLVVLTMLLVAGADRAHQRQRRGRGAAAGGRRDRRPHRPAAVAAADAARVRRARRVDAGAHRHARERDRVRRTPLELTGERLRVLRVRPGRRPAAARVDRRRPAARPAAAPGAAAASRCPPDLSRHARTLVEQYGLADSAVARDVAADAADVDVADRTSTSPPRSSAGRPASPRSSSRRARRSIGEAVFPGMVTDAGDLVVLAIQRGGEELGPGEVALAVGDTLLLQGTWDAVEEHAGDRARARVVDSPGARAPPGRAAGPGRRPRDRRPRRDDRRARDRRRAGGRRRTGRRGRDGRCCGCVTSEGAYRGISWTTVVLVAGMIPLSTAMTQTGAADVIADALVGVVGSLGPVRAARRAVRGHRRLRAADQQHGHGADRDPDRASPRRPTWASTSGRC